MFVVSFILLLVSLHSKQLVPQINLFTGQGAFPESQNLYFHKLD